jgi:fructose-1,6-bisphosphatase II
MRGEMQGRLVFMNDHERERAVMMGITDFDRVYNAEDMARGDVFFAATGVTNGDLLKGGRYFSGGAETHSVVMRSKSRTVRFVSSLHYFDYKPLY